MKIKINRHFKALLAISVLVLIPSIISVIPEPVVSRRWINKLPENYHTNDPFNAKIKIDNPLKSENYIKFISIFN